MALKIKAGILEVPAFVFSISFVKELKLWNILIKN